MAYLHNVLWLLVFWAMQIVAGLSFKFGSTSEARWLPGFVIGNVFGASSIWFMMLLYKDLHPNVVLGLTAGGAFLLVQLALALVFRQPMTFAQYGGLAAITAGMALFAVGMKG